MLRFLTAILLCIVALPSLTLAEDPAPIAVIDVPKILDQTKIGKAAKDVVSAERKKLTEEVDRAKGQYTSLRDELQKQGALLSPEAREQKLAALNQKEQEIQGGLVKHEEALRKVQVAEVERVLAKVDVVLKKLAEEKNFQYVLDGDPRVVLYRAPELDLTDRVITELGK